MKSSAFWQIQKLSFRPEQAYRFTAFLVRTPGDYAGGFLFLKCVLKNVFKNRFCVFKCFKCVLKRCQLKIF